jgi:hypothetical protein
MIFHYARPTASVLSIALQYFVPTQVENEETFEDDEE